ncbi:beta-1,3-galactosyltransferase 5-like [Haliotis rubra]|uniref:beta-1,3-galactosyltransferase 5-like n=1 Tax=Haliotis rubra TaxID=36100 RepID=UPI001EE6095B|nr:beta-1,3-galactosyltransferase 5-like [Haliotis rubra]XP_046549326.1 beta-1,3-galactosyltransferase 5-like [Haliotis rubra]
MDFRLRRHQSWGNEVIRRRRALFVMATTVICCITYVRFTRVWCCQIYRHSSHHGNTQTKTDESGVSGQELTDAKLEAFVRSGQVMKEYQFVVNSEVCSRSGVSQPVYLVAIVPSKPSNFHERQAIRQTWGSQFNKNEKLKLIFLSGLADEVTNMKLSSERDTFSDVVQADFIDSYKNLTRKTTAMLQWSKQFCPQARYVMKIDDDVFLESANLIRMLQLMEGEARAIIGYTTDTREAPIRDSSSKWHLSYEEYPFERFPRFVHGPSYVISGDLVTDLNEISRHVTRIYLEDVYVTGLCAHIASATIVGTSGLNTGLMYSPVWYMSELAGTSHGFTPLTMRRLWRVLQAWSSWRPVFRYIGSVVGY